MHEPTSVDARTHVARHVTQHYSTADKLSQDCIRYNVIQKVWMLHGLLLKIATPERCCHLQVCWAITQVVGHIPNATPACDNVSVKP